MRAFLASFKVNRYLALAFILPAGCFVLEYAALRITGPHGSDLQVPSYGWHVVGGALYHDGALDPERTGRMQDEIAAITYRQTVAEADLDERVRRRKETMGAGFDAERAAIYRRYEAPPRQP